jgi:uncharacterized protein YdaT
MEGIVLNPVPSNPSSEFVRWNPTKGNLPASMRSLSPEVRDKAIAIANALQELGVDERVATQLAVFKAREWGWQYRPAA